MNPLEPQADGDAGASRQAMSALADAQPDAADAALSGWTTDADARRTWHAYQLIGDVLRSDDLAVDASRDEALLHAVRARLAHEAAIVAPSAQPAGAKSGSEGAARRRWSVAAVAAGFLMVGGVVALLQGQDQGSRIASQPSAPGGVGLASRDASGAVTRVVQPGVGAPASGMPSTVGAAVAPQADPQWRMLDGKVMRDARLDAYLRAHRGSGAVSGRFATVVLER